ncbi:MAG: hypothetical protein U5K76_12780 [Woeseiaceae bacterium]|nr:hypothetical protein [Woeseiaceae bacterium]
MTRRLGHAVLTTTSSLLLAAGTLQAAELSYDYAELRYLNGEIEAGGADVDGDGFELAGSMQLAENVHLFGSYQALDFDFNVDTSALEIGAGYMMPVDTRTDFVARLSYVDGEVDTGFRDADDSGIGLSAGFRRMFTPQIEGRAFINHTELDESDGETTIEVAGDYFFNDEFAAGLSLEFGDDTTFIGIGGRYYFGATR